MKISELLVSFAISTPQTMFDQKTAEKWMDAMGVEDEEINFTVSNDLRKELKEGRKWNIAYKWFNIGMKTVIDRMDKDNNDPIPNFETLYASLNAKSDTI